MKLIRLIPGILALVINVSSCQNRSSDSKSAHSGTHSADSSTGTDTDSENPGGIMASMDKMMADMHQMQMTGNVDADFAMMMKGHHQGAVDMAQVEIDSGSDAGMKELARKIVLEQKKEIEQLDNFLDDKKDASKNYDPNDKNAGFGQVLEKNMTMMMEMPKHEDSTVDGQFVKMMIPHHQTAIHMAEGYIQHGKDPNLISMAKKMIADQNIEIEEMQNSPANK